MTQNPNIANTPPLADRYLTSDELILVLNCGSSSIKFALFDAGQKPLPRTPAWNGKVQDIGGSNASFGETGIAPAPVKLDAEQPYHAALRYIRDRVAARMGNRKLATIVHRVVHGGSKYTQPVRIDAQVLVDLRNLIPLAPLHQPFALEAMQVLLDQRPDMPQIACFDTAFHHTLPQVEQMLALPHVAYERGMKRFGFHGLSYDYMSVALPERHGDLARGNVIVAHLGSGASLCGLRGGKSVATTMGFSALDGLMMGTRCGSVDPGAIIYLMEVEKLSLERVGHALYHESGLLGVSGLSSEPRVLLAHENDPGIAGDRVRSALRLYVHRIVREIGAMATTMGGLDLLVFTAGIGEHSAPIRQRIVDGLGLFNIKLDAEANETNAPVISSADSAITVAVEPTNEEWVAAQHALVLTKPAKSQTA